MLILFQNVERLFCSFRSKDSVHFLPTFRVGYDRLLEQVTREIRSVRRNQSHLLSLDLVATQILAYLSNQKICFQLCHSAACNKNRKKVYIYFSNPTIYSRQFTFIVRFPPSWAVYQFHDLSLIWPGKYCTFPNSPQPFLSPRKPHDYGDLTLIHNGGHSIRTWKRLRCIPLVIAWM